LILITSAISSSLYYPISNEQIITISGTVDTIEEELSRDKYDGLTINFNEYPNITFHININDLDENVANDILTNQKYLNTIFIQIYDRDYKLKISKEIKPGFFEMHFGWSGLKVYGLKTKNEINFSKFGFETNE